MRISFLLFMAAVPLLGEPAQIKKPKNEENRKKITKEESLSSCHTGPNTSLPHKRSPLKMELPESANLFGQPGTRHRSPLVLSNLLLAQL